MSDEERDIEEGLKYTEEFEQFWTVYPRKHGKSMAFLAYKGRLSDGFTDDALLCAAQNYANECREKRIKTRFIQYANFFLARYGVFADYIPGCRNREDDETGGAE